MLKAALSGSYVNFGVFRLYGDNALDEALQMFIKLLLSVPLKDLLVSQFYSNFSKNDEWKNRIFTILYKFLLYPEIFS